MNQPHIASFSDNIFHMLKIQIPQNYKEMSAAQYIIFLIFVTKHFAKTKTKI